MSKDVRRVFKQGELERLSKILADAATGTEIGHFLSQIGVPDPDHGMTKWKRLFNALAEQQNATGSGNKLLSFINVALAPPRFVGNSARFHSILRELNTVLAFHGLEFREDGNFHTVTASRTLSEAENRADKLATLVRERNLHPDLLAFCTSELLADDYFHAVLEATKSVMQKIRDKSGLDADGQKLIENALLGSNPQLLINSFTTDSERSEQKGFASLLSGLVGTFRNPTAHEPRVAWRMKESDAYDLFTLASYAHRRIDAATNR
jgi:uncharacterized protein (TIGR02391 family)